MVKRKYSVKRGDIAETLFQLQEDVQDMLESLEAIERALEGCALDIEAQHDSVPPSKW